MITAEIVGNTEAFRQLKPEWEELLQASSHDCIFLSWEWLFLWWKHLGKNRQLHMVAVRRSGRLIALAPMTVRPRKWLRLLPHRAVEFLGTGQVGSDYLNIVIRKGEEEAAMDAILGALAESRLVLEMSHIERTSFLIVNLALQFRRLGWQPLSKTIEFCPYISLRGHDWESYLASLGKSHRANFRRKSRKLHKDFDVSFESAACQDERHEALRTLVSLHLQRWRPRGGSDALEDERLIAFHEEFTRHALERGWLRLYTLRLDGKPVASLYGFLYRDVFYFYQSGFDPDYRDYSVGLIVMGLAIREAIGEQAEEFDLLHGREQYKYLWARGERELVKLELYPPFVSGRMYRLLMQGREGVKKWLGARITARIRGWFGETV